MRILIVNHDVSNYGAANSLSLMLHNNPHIECDMIVPIRAMSNVSRIKEKFNIKNGRLYFLSLFVDLTCYVGEAWQKRSFIDEIFYQLKTKKDYLKYLFLIKNNNYDLIYINSIVLYRYIVSFKKCLIHVRERFKKNDKPVVKYINKSAGVIFIDNSTYLPFCKFIKVPFRIINNPFDMTPLNKGAQAKAIFGIDTNNNTIFSMIGQVKEQKGVYDVIRAFQKVKNRNIRLLIAGNCKASFLAELKTLSNNDKRILFLGHCDDINKIYNVTDYLIRGEQYQCIGRTMIEALFSGCAVLVPGTRPYREFGLSRFDDKIHFYTPLDFDYLEKLIGNLAGKKMIRRIYRSNIGEHVKKINGFIATVV